MAFQRDRLLNFDRSDSDSDNDVLGNVLPSDKNARKMLKRLEGFSPQDDIDQRLLVGLLQRDSQSKLKLSKQARPIKRTITTFDATNRPLPVLDTSIASSNSLIPLKQTNTMLNHTRNLSMPITNGTDVLGQSNSSARSIRQRYKLDP